MNKFLLSTALVLTSSLAYAQEYNEYDYDYYEPAAPESEYAYPDTEFSDFERPWDLSISTGLRFSPEYKGSNDSEVSVFILPDAQYQLDYMQRVFLSLKDGAGYGLSLTENLEIGGGIGYREGRDSSDDTLLAGMDDIDDTLTLMAFAKYSYDQFNLGARLEKGLDSTNDGMTTTLSADYKQKMDEQLTLGAGFSTVYANDTYMKQNFGVSSADAISGRAAYNAESGFSEANLDVFANYNIVGPHNVMGKVAYTKLLGDAKDSTIVQDDQDISFVLGYTYKF